MPPIRPERLTTCRTGDVLVLLIGMRVNRPWKPHKWVPVFRSFWRMIAELKRDAPANGFLGYQPLLASGPTFLTAQYWESAESLHAYAHDPARHHASAWRDFIRRVSTSGDVGVFHESYVSRGGDWEVIHINMPPFGLLASTESRPCAGGRQMAHGRMAAGATPGGEDEAGEGNEFPEPE